MSLNDLKVYNLAMKLGEDVWAIVSNWDYFQKDTIGKQLVRSTDSVAANISEGYGRFHFKDSNKFNYYSRGSLYETKTWLTKAFNRNMIAKDRFQGLIDDIELLGKMLNSYITSVSKLNEPQVQYEPSQQLTNNQ